MPISVRRGRSYGTVSSDAVAFLARRTDEEGALHVCANCGDRRFRVVASDCQIILTCLCCDELCVLGTARVAAEPGQCECAGDSFFVAVAKTRDGVATAGRCAHCGMLHLFSVGRRGPVQQLSRVGA